MKARRLLWQVYPSFLLIMLVSVAAIGWYAFSSTQEFYYAQVAEDLKASAHIVEDQVLDSYEPGDSNRLHFCSIPSASCKLPTLRRTASMPRSGPRNATVLSLAS